MFRSLAFAALAVFATSAGARNYTVSPATPTAMEFVQLRSFIGGCERLRGVEVVDGGFRINIEALTTGLTCDEVLPLTLTLGAFAPGFYRVTTRISCNICSPPVFDEPQQSSFTVSAGVASTVAGDDRPQSELSGIWTSPSEPFTGFAFIHSDGVGATGRSARVTGLWYDYGATGQVAWTLLLLDGTPFRLTGQVVRALPTGTGTSRTIVLSPVGNATLVLAPSGGYRLSGNVEQRVFDFPIERFRWVRAAWPGRAPDGVFQ